MKKIIKIHFLVGMLTFGVMFQVMAQSSDTLYVNKTNNFAVSDDLDNISKLTFSATEMFVHKNLGEVNTFFISNIQTITFNRLYAEESTIGMS